MKTRAFTLIEVIMVITMITLITGTFMLDFRGARERQQVLVAAEQSLALLQQAHAEVQAGAISDGSWVCRGGHFSEGELPELAEAKVIGSSCDWSSLSTSGYGMNGSGQVLSSTAAYVMFVPPEGELVMYNGASEVSGDASIVLGSDTVSSEFTVHVSALTGQAAILSNADE